MRCLMCEEPDTTYIPSDDVDETGLYSCGRCGFETEGPSEKTTPDPWHLALIHARQDGQDEQDARDFADEYAAYVEDHLGENRYPDLPLPTPSEYTR